MPPQVRQTVPEAWLPSETEIHTQHALNADTEALQNQASI